MAESESMPLACRILTEFQSESSQTLQASSIIENTEKFGRRSFSPDNALSRRQKSSWLKPLLQGTKSEIWVRVFTKQHLW